MSNEFAEGREPLQIVEIEPKKCINTYGVAPCTAQSRVSAEYLLLDGTSGTFASTPDSAANSVTGDLHIFARVAADDWTPGTLRTIAAKRNGGAGNTSYAFRLDSSGKLTLYWVSPSAPTTYIVRSSTIAVPAVDGAYADVEAMLDVDNGASGHDVKFLVNGDQLGDTITTAGVTSIIDRDLAVQIGAIDAGAAELWKGKISRVAIRNGINGPLAAVFDASDGKHLATSFVSSETGETWTMNGNAQLIGSINKQCYNTRITCQDIPNYNDKGFALEFPGTATQKVEFLSSAYQTYTLDVVLRCEQGGPFYTQEAGPNSGDDRARFGINALGQFFFAMEGGITGIQDIGFKFNERTAISFAADKTQFFSRTYHQGRLAAQQDNSNDVPNLPAASGFIGFPGSSAIFYKGIIDEVRVWNYVRSAEEVKRDLFRSVPVDSPGLVHYWKLDEHTGSTAVDLAGGANGTITEATHVRGLIDNIQLLRFCKAAVNVPIEFRAIPSLVSVSTNPTELNIGGSNRNSGALGIRSSISATFVDHPDPDIQTDPYFATRDYDPIETGTFWSKFQARNPYYQNMIIRVRDGYIGQNLDDMVKRTYFTDDIFGPDSSNRVQIKGRDVLRIADNKKAQAPLPTPGALDEAITAVSTSLLINSAELSDYPAPGTVRIGDETITFTGSALNLDRVELTGLTRGTDGTTAAAHSVNDAVQLCLRYTNVRCDLIVRDLLVNYSDIDPIYLDDWEAEASEWLGVYTISALITEPTGIATLISEISEQCLFYIWWDERASLIRLKAIRPEGALVRSLNEEANIIEGSVQVNTRADERLSLIDISFIKRSATGDDDSFSNFAQRRLRIDLVAEDLYGERRIKRLFSRWLQSDAQVINTSTNILTRYRDNTRYLMLKVDAKDRQLWTGDVVDITVRQVTDFTGAPVLTRWQIISAEEVVPGETVQYKLQMFQFGAGARYGFYMIESAPVFTLATDEQKARGAWYAGADGLMSDGSEGYRYQ